MRLRSLLVCCAALAAACVCIPAASAGDVTHGIGFTKGCASPTKIGDPYTCAWSVRNIFDDAQDTLFVTALTDTIHAAGGNVNSGNILGSVTITTDGGATCIADAGTGTIGSPYTGVTSCTLPFNGRVVVQPFSYYTVQPGDFALPSNQLKDDSSLTWHDLCDDPAGTGDTNCNPNPPTPGASSLSLIQRLGSSTATDIHNAAHQTVTSVAAGATVHDFVTVIGQAGKPVPTGNVTVDFFSNNQCMGGPDATSAPIALAAGGGVDATSFAQGPLGQGSYGFLAHYPGDATYSASNGPCESLTVVEPDANIQLTPETATNPIGTNHTLHCHVNVSSDGVTFSNAPSGTVCTVAVTSGPGTPTSQNCTTSGTTGTCDATITSSTPGTSTLNASTTVAVNGEVLTRTTNGSGGNSGPATKLWADSAVRTDVHDAAHNVITTATAGGLVHDKVFVTKAAGTPAAVPTPTGNVVFSRFNNTTCASSAASTQIVAVGADGTAESATFTATGDLSYQAQYLGDANYPAHTGACEALPVSSVTPATVCNLTVQYVHASAKYQGLPTKQKQALDKTITTFCAATLGQIKPGISTAKKKVLVTAYKVGATVLALGGYLTKAQLTELAGLADKL